jgi:5-formyltetrahydrofolate cyclo-ligase
LKKYRLQQSNFILDILEAKLIQTKQELRKTQKKVIASMGQQKLLDKSKNLSLNLLDLLEKFQTIQLNKLIGVYAPMSDEVDWSLEFKNTYDDCLAFPATDDDGEMIFKKSSLSDLEITKQFGVEIKTPKENAKTVMPDILVIPGLGFSKKGERLGRGKGYYDKFLNNFKGIKIGCCFNELLIEEIPTEAHDELVDYVVTDTQIAKTQL